MPNANHDKETEIWSKESPMDAVCRGESSELAAPGNMRARWAKEKKIKTINRKHIKKCQTQTGKNKI